jgi:arylamine N-acetyltransferase
VLTRRSKDGTAATTELATWTELRAVLAEQFGLAVPADLRLATPGLAGLT